MNSSMFLIASLTISGDGPPGTFRILTFSSGFNALCTSFSSSSSFSSSNSMHISSMNWDVISSA